MEINYNLRKYRKHLHIIDGFVKNNPVLFLGLALPFAIIIANDLRSSIMVSAFMLAISLPTAILAHFIGKFIKREDISIVLFSFLEIVIVVSIIPFLSKYTLIIESIGLYLPLIATNSLTIMLTERASKKSFWITLKDVFFYILGFAFTVCLLGFLREFLTQGTILGKQYITLKYKFSAAGLPCLGFILLGFIGAFIRIIDRAHAKKIALKPIVIKPSKNEKEAIENE